MARVFVSHAGRDRVIAGEVAGWLSGAGHELFYDEDLRAGLAVGEQWQDRLFERLRWADAVVCVITSAFVASAWCSAEVGVAISRGSRVVPVVVEAGVGHPLLDGVQFADYAGNRAAARAVVAEALRRVDAGGGRGWVDGRSPFPGLRPFDTEMSRVFFGRRAEVGKLTELLRSPATRADRGVVVVTGPSGCGKSSLVRAGLLPAMAEEPGWWTLPVMLPGADPVAVLAREFTGEAQRLGLDWQLPVVRSRLDRRDVAAFVDELLLAAPGTTVPRRRLLVVIDQFEELLTVTGSADRAAFAGILRDAMAGSATVVATLRPEFLTAMLGSGELGVLRPRSFLLRPLDREMLSEVILGPADLAGMTVHPELVGRLVADTGGGEALPLLAFTLQQLAVDVPRGGNLSMTRYERLGGVGGALTAQADEAMLAATAATGRTAEQVLAGLLRLVSVNEHGTPIRTRVPVEDLAEGVQVELGEFTARRLLTSDTEIGLSVIGVAHEAFLTAWPPLAEAITRHGAALRARRAVEAGAAEWDAAGRHRNRLWERGRLAAALNDLDDPTRVGNRQPPTPSNPSRAVRRRPTFGRRRPRGTTIELSPRARDFLATSIRTDRRRRARGTTILSLLLVVALSTGGAAVRGQQSAREQQQLAQEQQRVATARQLLAQVATIGDSDPRTAQSLALAAYELYPGDQTDAALFNHLVDSPVEALLTGHNGAANSVVYTNDGHTLATGGADGAILLWDVTDPTRPTRMGAPLTGNNAHVMSVAFTPDGHTLATGGADGATLLWNVTDPARPTRIGDRLRDNGAPVTSTVFTPDGHTLITSGADGTVIKWNVTDPAQPRSLGQLPITGPGAWGSTAFTPDGHILARSGADGAILLWNIADPAQPRFLGQLPPTGPVSSVTFDENGHLATGSADGTVILWNITDPTQPTRIGDPLTGQTGPINSAAFTPDGHTLATGSADGTVILWNATDPTQPTRIGDPLTGHTGLVTSVAITPDGHTLATGSADGTVILWNATDPTQPTRIGDPLTGHTGPINSAAFTPDGQTLATVSADGTVILWNVTDPSEPRSRGQLPLTGPGRLGSMAFSPDGHTLATVSADRAVLLWNVTDPSQPRSLGQLPVTGPVTSVTFAPDGHTLASSSLGGAVTLWDVTDPAQPTRIGDPLTGRTGLVMSMALTPDGKTLATGSLDGAVILWNVTDPNQPTRIGDPLTGHTGAVRSMTFTPDGQTLVAGADDDKVIMWDVTDPTQPTRIGDPLGHTGSVRAMTFTPDGNTLATGSIDGTVILWEIKGITDLRNRLAQRACSVTGQGLSPDEWARYIPDLPYQDACKA